MKFYKQKGQTLVEVLVTLILVSVSVIALIRFQNYLSYDNTLAHQKAEATILANKQIETLKDFHVLNNLTGYTSYQSIATGNTSAAGKTTNYTITTTITTNTNPDYKTADVTVTWTDRNNQSQSVRLITIIAGIDPPNSAVII